MEATGKKELQEQQRELESREAADIDHLKAADGTRCMEGTTRAGRKDFKEIDMLNKEREDS